MVTVFMRGGLGNQMFQYAAGLSLAKKNNTELFLDTVHISDRFPRPNFTYRNFDLGIFTLEPRFTAMSRIARAVPVPGVWLGLDLLGMNLKGVLGGRKVIYEDEAAGFDPGILQVRGNIILFGRWENEKYFSDVADEVRSAFSFRWPLEGEAAKVAREIAKTNSVSLHVRRGDFVKFKKVEGLMGKMDIGYYDRATAYLAERVRSPHFFIFSDDAAWCRENIKIKFPATYLENDTAGPKASGHLELMSLCKHNIIANSTFSWWSGWLNANSQKIVIAPKHWYANPSIKDDVVPTGWVKA